MDSSSYLLNSERTLSRSFHGDSIPHDYFVDLVARTLLLGEELDALKRELFYGTPNSYHGVPLDFASSLAGFGTGRSGSDPDAGLGDGGSAVEAGGRDPGLGGLRGTADVANTSARTDAGSGSRCGVGTGDGHREGTVDGGRASGGLRAEDDRASGSGSARPCDRHPGVQCGYAGPHPDLLHAVLGILTEGTELLQAVHNDPLDRVNLLEETGDVEWYLAIVYRFLERLPEEARERNIAKLRRRFPGRFSETEAVTRNLASERQALEDTEAHPS